MPPGPIDPESIATREELGADLTALRLRAGLTVRELATRARLPTATVGGWVTARHLPGPSQHEQFRALLTACGVAPREHQVWLDAIARVRRSTDGRATRQIGEARAPYRGLEPFQPEDAALFFGRDAFTSLVLVRLSRLGRQPSDLRTPRMLFVVGASGSGKSSVLRAGVYPAVAAGALKDPDGRAWRASIITPGASPVETLRSRLREVSEPRLVIIDQFEELYTLTTDEQVRADFVAELVAAGERTVFAAGMRADFFASAARDPSLVLSLQDWQLVVPPMSIEELRAVVVGPAKARRIAVEDALVETVIADVFPRTAGTLRQNALPLLSHALLAAWQHRRRGPLTLQDYRGTGGLAGAVQQSAEDAFAELDAAGQDVCRRLFLRLITVDEDLVTTRRRVDRAELEDLDVAHVIELFVARRLVTVDDTSVEISHEALLAAWPRLAEWIAADHESLRLHRRLTGAANTWQAGDFDDHLLLRGPQLGTVEEWAADPDHAADLNRLERDFVQSSLGARDREVRAGRRRAAQLRAIVAALAVLLLIAIGTTVYAVHASRVADSQRSAATIERDRALSRQIAIESQRAATTDLALAEQLGVTAVHITSTVDARSALLDAVAGGVVTRVVGPSGPTTVARNRAGTLMAISNAATGSVAVHRSDHGRPGPVTTTIPPSARGAQIFALAFSPVADVLALGGAGGVVRLVDLIDPTRPTIATLPGQLGIGVQGLAFTPSGDELFASGAGPGIRRWDVTDPRRPHPLPAPSRAADIGVVQSITVSPDGAELVAGTADGVTLSWPTADLAAEPHKVQQAPSAIDFVRYSPDGSQLVTGSKDAHVTVFSARHGDLRADRRLQTDFTSWANAASYSPDGQQLALGSADGKIDVFDTGTWTMSRSITNSSQVTALAYDPTGSLLTAASADGVVRVFPVLGATMSGLGGPVFAISVSGSGDRIAAASTSATGAVSIWSVDDHRAPRFAELGTVPLPSSFGAPDGTVALSRDGRLVAAGNARGKVLVDRVEPSGRPQPRPVVLDSGSETIESVAVNPAGTVLATGSDDGRVRLWNLDDPARPQPLPPLRTGGEIANVAFSPDGRFVAGASVDHKVHLWSLTASGGRPVAVLGGFSNYAWSVAFSPDSTILAGGGADNSVRLWDIKDPAHPRLLGGAFRGPTHYVFALAFSPDGTTLAGAGGDGSVWMWSIADPAHPVVDATLRAADPGGGTYTATFTPDGRHLAAAGTSGDVTFWNTSVDTAIRVVCRLRGTPITRSEWRSNVPGVPYQDPCR